MGKLTARKVETAKPGKYGDGDGLQLSIASSGAKKWVLRFLWQGKAREMGLGSFPEVGLAEAREKAIAGRRLARSGIDPIAERKQDSRVPTFGELADEVVIEQSKGFRNEKHRAQWKMTLETYAAPLRPSPEGQKYTVNGPDGATQDQAFQILQGQIGGQTKGGAPAPKGKSWDEDVLPALNEGLNRGADALIGLPGDAWHGARFLANKVLGSNDPINDILPTSESLRKRREAFAGPGYGLKRLSSVLSQGDAQSLQEVARARSPLGGQVRSSLDKFGRAATVMKGSPSPQNSARFMLATRNLSTNLADAGIDISPENIVRATVGPND